MSNQKLNIVLYYTDSKLQPIANALSEFTGRCELLNSKPGNISLYLLLDYTGLAIISDGFKPLYITEIYDSLVSRYKKLKDELLVQIIRDKKGANIWDLTAGLGKDAFIMASAGYNVVMIEQNPMLATILFYALNYNILPRNNLQLVYANSIEYIDSKIDIAPDIIYLDPMFKELASSKSKKEMQLIQVLTSDDIDLDDVELFNKSYGIAKARVIVKRDNKQSSLVDTPLPTYNKSGKTIRFDIYNK